MLFNTSNITTRDLTARCSSLSYPVRLTEIHRIRGVTVEVIGGLRRPLWQHHYTTRVTSLQSNRATIRHRDVASQQDPFLPASVALSPALSRRSKCCIVSILCPTGDRLDKHPLIHSSIVLVGLVTTGINLMTTPTRVIYLSTYRLATTSRLTTQPLEGHRFEVVPADQSGAEGCFDALLRTRCVNKIVMVAHVGSTLLSSLYEIYEHFH